MNVEGFSKSKADILERIMTEDKIDVLIVQETHTADKEQLLKRGLITGFTIGGATFRSKYGTTTSIKSDLNGITSEPLKKTAFTLLILKLEIYT